MRKLSLAIADIISAYYGADNCAGWQLNFIDGASTTRDVVFHHRERQLQWLQRRRDAVRTHQQYLLYERGSTARKSLPAAVKCQYQLRSLHRVNIGTTLNKYHDLFCSHALGEHGGHNICFIVVGDGNKQIQPVDMLFCSNS